MLTISLLYKWSGVFAYYQTDSEYDTAYLQGFITNQKRPKYTQITRIIEGFETLEFRSYFEKWPLNGQHPVSEEGRGKVAGILNILSSFSFALVFIPADYTFPKGYDEHCFSKIRE